MDYRFGPAERANALRLIAQAIEEDLGDAGDLTSLATIPAQAEGSAVFVSRTEGVLAGLPVVALLAEHLKLEDGFVALADDGDRVSRGQPLARVDGLMRSILAFERTALNFLQRLSGVATLTAAFVAEVAGTKAQILDTRKTTPGWRFLEKYAVRCGGGTNHRIGLFDAVLIKDNHLACLAEQFGADQAIARAVTAARGFAPVGTVIEIEVDDLVQLDAALAVVPDIVLVDNFGPDALAEALLRRDRVAPGVLIEVSGGVNLRTVRALSETGVDRISVGALTHSASALDIGLDYV